MDNDNEEYNPEMDKALNDIDARNREGVAKDDIAAQTLDQLRDVRAALLRGNTKTPDVKEEWKRVVERARAQRDDQAVKPERRQSKQRIFWWTIGGMAAGVAATIAILFSLGFLVQNHQADSDSPILLYSALETPGQVMISSPGERGEVTIQKVAQAQGQKAVTKGQLSKEREDAAQPADDAVELLDMRSVTGSELEERIVTTPIGKNLRIILGDNTEVLLNSESSLRFPLCFADNNRTVYLEGEAFFDVACNPERPFNVISQNICTTALGTEFDVRAYQRADVKVVLLEGSVKVVNLSDNASVLLEPGQDATSVGGKLIVSETDTKALVYWKDGYFYFDDVPLVDMMIELGRWYNVNVELNQRSLMSYRMHFVAGRNEDVGDIVSRLNRLGHFAADFDGNTLTIKENNGAAQ